MSHLGKTVRLRRLFDRETGKTFIVALDHAIGWDVIRSIANLEKTLGIVMRGSPNAVTMMKGPVCKLFASYAGSNARCLFSFPFKQRRS